MLVGEREANDERYRQFAWIFVVQNETDPELSFLVCIPMGFIPGGVALRMPAEYLIAVPVEDLGLLRPRKMYITEVTRAMQLEQANAIMRRFNEPPSHRIRHAPVRLCFPSNWNTIFDQSSAVFKPQGDRNVRFETRQTSEGQIWTQA